MIIYNEAVLVQKMSLLPEIGRVAFATIISTRMRAAYNAYLVDPDSTGSMESYDKALSVLWESVRHNKLQKFPDLLDEVMELIPEEDDRWKEFSSLADDAVSSLAYAFRCLQGGAAQEAAWAARRAYETVDSLVSRKLGQSADGADIAEEDITNDDWIQRELRQQAEDYQLAMDGVSGTTPWDKIWMTSLNAGKVFFADVLR